MEPNARHGPSRALRTLWTEESPSSRTDMVLRRSRRRMAATGSAPSILQKVEPQRHIRGLRRSRSLRTGILSRLSTAPPHLCNFLNRNHHLMAIRAMFLSSAVKLSEHQKQASPTSPCPIQVLQLSQRSTGMQIVGVRIGIICQLPPRHSVAKSTRSPEGSTRAEKRA